MNARLSNALLHLAGPRVGNEVRKLVRELKRLAGVVRVVPSTKVPRLRSINYDPRMVQAHAIVQYVRRGWTGTRLV